MSRQRSIMIGDYADITFIKPESNDTDGHAIYDSIYRYYIIKINDNEIIVEQWDDFNQTLILKPNDNGIWQIDRFTETHAIVFGKNAATTEYIERDFMKSPTKITTIIVSKSGIYSGREYTELNNGIILYDIVHVIGTIGFTDPSNTKNLTPFITVNKDSTFLEAKILNNEENISIYNLDGEIFLLTHKSLIIVKLNLNDLSLIEYDKNPQYRGVHPLKNKKILCLLRDGSMYILDLTKEPNDYNKRIVINTTILTNSSILQSFSPSVYQLSTGDVILTYWAPHNYMEIYRLNINDVILSKMLILNNPINIISVLKDDTFLVVNPGLHEDSKEIQIWDFKSGEIINIATFYYYDNTTNKNKIIPIIPAVLSPYTIPTIHKRILKPNLTPLLIPINGLLLQNGDILINIREGGLYLFSYETRQITKISSILDKITPIYDFKELKNGNVLISTERYVAVVELPHSQSVIDRNNFDQISQSIKASLQLPAEMLNLIRNYL